MEHWDLNDADTVEGECESCGMLLTVQLVSYPLSNNYEAKYRLACSPCFEKRGLEADKQND